MPPKELLITKEMLNQAQQIANGIWGTYDDSHGYASKKQGKNSSVSTDNLENIHFFIGQFDIQNQFIMYIIADRRGFKDLRNYIRYIIKSSTDW